MKYARIFSLVILFFVSGLSGQAQTITGKQALEDLNFLVQTIEKVHYNPYLYTNKQVWQQQVARYKQKYQGVKRLQITDFSLDMQKLVAHLGDKYTTVGFPKKETLQHMYSKLFFSSSLRFTSERQVKILQPGLSEETLLEINGQNMAALYQEAWSLLNGPTHFKKRYMHYYFPLFLFHKGIRAPFTLTVRNNKGEYSTKTYPESYATTLINLIKGVHRSNVPYWLQFIKPDIAYLAYDRCINYKRFSTFLDSSFRVIKEKKIRKLIIDIRYNTVENSSLNNLNDLLLSYITSKSYRQMATRDWKVSQLMKERMDSSLYQNALGKEFINKYLKAKNGTYLKETFPLIKPKKPTHFFNGITCLLTGPLTSANASFLADAVNTYQLTQIIGTSTGQLTNYFSEFISFSMPYSKLSFSCSVAYHVGADGNAKKKQCVVPYIDSLGDAIGIVKAWFDGK